MRTRLICIQVAFLAFLICSASAQPSREKIPNSGTKATVLRDTKIYISPDKSSSQLSTINPGREMVIVERNGPWLRVFANTDVNISSGPDTPVFGSQPSPPISGWIEAAGTVEGATPKGDLILFGEAATEEVEASEPHAPRGAAQAAQLLYQRMVDLFPNSPLTPEAAWRSADVRWQLQKADVFSLPSAHEREAYLREEIDETQMRKIEKMYPHSRWSDLAAWDMLDNKICGSWEGSTKCPEKEAELYEKYAQDHPDSPKAPQALYEAAYRQAVLNDMYGSNGDDKKADAAKDRAIGIAGTLESKYPQSDYSARVAGLIYKLQASIPIYGTDRE
jgi:outer membrane protein assembly factor BamD (BamD/ComL family)